MRFSKLLHEAGIDASLAEDKEITGVCADSRAIREGEVFVAITGIEKDGAAYVGEALEKGAAAVIAEKEAAGVTLTVPRAREALARLADAFWGHPARGMELIGVTGTNGKTSTALMLFHILRHAGHSCGLIGTVECRADGEVLTLPNKNALANMTTPDPTELYEMLAVMREKGVRYVIMEVTSHALAFDKVAPLFFSRALFTNLTPDHLDLHGDMERYFAEKRKLFGMCGAAIVSASTPYGRRLAEDIAAPCTLLDEHEIKDVVLCGARGVSFTVFADSVPVRIDLPVAGDFSVENGALAAKTALTLGVKPDAVREALSAFQGVKGRMERVAGTPDGISVFIDYAHTPDALEKLLRCVRGFRAAGERIIVLFGCGGDRDRGKRREMGRIASRLADFTVVTSDNCRGEDPKAIISEILRGVDKEKPFAVIEERREAIRYAVKIARKGDILLLAGKGHEEYEIRGRERLPFSEREIVREAFAERGDSV